LAIVIADADAIDLQIPSQQRPHEWHYSRRHLPAKPHGDNSCSQQVLGHHSDANRFGDKLAIDVCNNPQSDYLDYLNKHQSDIVLDSRAQNNQLAGTLPTELATLSKIDTLEVFGNKLVGAVPSIQIVAGRLSCKVQKESDTNCLDCSRYNGACECKAVSNVCPSTIAPPVTTKSTIVSTTGTTTFPGSTSTSNGMGPGSSSSTTGSSFLEPMNDGTSSGSSTVASATPTIATTAATVQLDSNDVVSPPSVDGTLIGAIVGGVLGGLLIIGAIVGLICFFSRRSNSDNASSPSDVSLSPQQSRTSEYGSAALAEPPYDAPPTTSSTRANIYGPAPSAF
jgi:hypothetical protein